MTPSGTNLADIDLDTLDWEEFLSAVFPEGDSHAAESLPIFDVSGAHDIAGVNMAPAAELTISPSTFTQGREPEASIFSPPSAESIVIEASVPTSTSSSITMPTVDTTAGESASSVVLTTQLLNDPKVEVERVFRPYEEYSGACPPGRYLIGMSCVDLSWPTGKFRVICTGISADGVERPRTGSISLTRTCPNGRICQPHGRPWLPDRKQYRWRYRHEERKVDCVLREELPWEHHRELARACSARMRAKRPRPPRLRPLPQRPTPILPRPILPKSSLPQPNLPGYGHRRPTAVAPGADSNTVDAIVVTVLAPSTTHSALGNSQVCVQRPAVTRRRDDCRLRAVRQRLNPTINGERDSIASSSALFGPDTDCAYFPRWQWPSGPSPP